VFPSLRVAILNDITTMKVLRSTEVTAGSAEGASADPLAHRPNAAALLPKSDRGGDGDEGDGTGLVCVRDWVFSLLVARGCWCILHSLANNGTSAHARSH
jgi:hypothetical protein